MAATTKEEWLAIEAEIKTTLADNAELIEGFRSKVIPVFVAMLEGKGPFTKRPPASLRLICAGDPPAKLILHPGWNTVKKTVDTSHLSMELFEERIFKAMNQGQEVEVRKFDSRFAMGANGQKVRAGSYAKAWHKDVARVLEVMHDFLTDHDVVFARSHDHCCCCGKPLSDELSRSRGIGPECIRTICLPRVAADWNSIVVRDEPVAEEPEVWALRSD